MDRGIRGSLSYGLHTFLFLSAHVRVRPVLYQPAWRLTHKEHRCSATLSPRPGARKVNVYAAWYYCIRDQSGRAAYIPLTTYGNDRRGAAS